MDLWTFHLVCNRSHHTKYNFVIENTPQDIEYTSQDIVYTLQDIEYT